MKHLVFQHGYLGGSAQWAAQSNYFSAHYNVHTPDLPGFGLNNESVSPDTIGGYADFVLNYLSDKGVEQFDLVGHSMGGMIVQEMVARAPARITRLVVYGTGSLGALPGRFEPLSESRRRLDADGLSATGRRISATWFLNRESAPGYEACAALTERASLQAAQAALCAMEDWSGERNLNNIACPTLVLWGDNDRTYNWAQQEKLWREIRHARLSVLAGCAHAVHLEKPDLFNATLDDFLAQPYNCDNATTGA
ncbi:MAG: alpha/beta hydrolase [Pseudomonadota bacterium]